MKGLLGQRAASQRLLGQSATSQVPPAAVDPPPPQVRRATVGDKNVISVPREARLGRPRPLVHQGQVVHELVHQYEIFRFLGTATESSSLRDEFPSGSRG